MFSLKGDVKILPCTGRNLATDIMSNPLIQIRQSLFAISKAEASFVRRGFVLQKEQETRAFLEKHAETFVEGYNLALQFDQIDKLALALAEIEVSRSGFAFEGAAMGLSLLDYFSPWRNRLSTFMQTAGNGHLYMLYVGAGWTLGRLPRSPQRFLNSFDPVLKWLATDGYGFHEGFFHWPRTLIAPFKRPPQLSGYMLRSFDQGLGRSLWFVKGASIHRIHETINLFPVERRADLWSGIGLASTYAGGVTVEDVHQIFIASGQFQDHFAQGVAFAARARERAGNLTTHTSNVCNTIWNLSAEEIASIVTVCLQSVTTDDQAYENWRNNIRLHFQHLDQSRSASNYEVSRE